MVWRLLRSEHWIITLKVRSWVILAWGLSPVKLKPRSRKWFYQRQSKLRPPVSSQQDTLQSGLAMDPLACLSVASSVVQFVDFAFKIFSKSKEIYDEGRSPAMPRLLGPSTTLRTSVKSWIGLVESMVLLETWRETKWNWRSSAKSARGWQIIWLST
jgi:hypothetical protein